MRTLRGFGSLSALLLAAAVLRGRDRLRLIDALKRRDVKALRGV